MAADQALDVGVGAQRLECSRGGRFGRVKEDRGRIRVGGERRDGLGKSGGVGHGCNPTTFGLAGHGFGKVV